MAGGCESLASQPGPLYPASGDAGSAEAMESDILLIQLWVSTAAVGASGRGSSAAVHCARPRMGDRPRSGKFFDRVNHDKLMGQIAKRVEDKRLLKLIRAFLNAGVMENPERGRNSARRTAFATAQ